VFRNISGHAQERIEVPPGVAATGAEAGDGRRFWLAHSSDARTNDWTDMTDPDQGGNRRGAMAGLAIAVVLLAVGVWLAHELTAASKMQDCLMSGRTNCNVIPAQ
jgi:hypothetical protein